MAYKVQKPCRVCGKMYTPCADCENDKTAFHWRTVACSRECGAEYFKRVMDGRQAKEPEPVVEVVETEPEIVIDVVEEVQEPIVEEPIVTPKKRKGFYKK